MGTDWESAAAPGGGGVLEGVFGAYRERGYAWGYRRGVADVLAAMLVLAGPFTERQQADAAAVRRLLHGFEAFVEDHLQRSSEAGFVSEGLGI